MGVYSHILARGKESDSLVVCERVESAPYIGQSAAGAYPEIRIDVSAEKSLPRLGSGQFTFRPVAPRKVKPRPRLGKSLNFILCFFLSLHALHGGKSSLF